MIKPIKDCKESRDSQQTSTLVNKQHAADVEETLQTNNKVILSHGNAQSSMFYSTDVDAMVKTILQLLLNSNAVQKNKGDVAELISFVYTC